MSQHNAQYAVGDQAATERLSRAFERAGYKVRRADTMGADIAVRYRMETGDEEDMARIAASSAPEARRVNDTVPTVELDGYRADHA